MPLYWMTLVTTSIAVVACVAQLLRGSGSARGDVALAISAFAAFAVGTALAWPLHGAQLAVWLAAALPAGQGVGRAASVNGMLLIVAIAWAAVLFAAGVMLATWRSREPAALARGLGGRLLRTMSLGSIDLLGPEPAPIEPRRGTGPRRLKLVHSTTWRDGPLERPGGR